jgi:predicted transcriptional regulator
MALKPPTLVTPRLIMPRHRGMIHGMANVRNFHLPLPEPLYRRLRDAAERTNQPATTLARYAIDQWLRQHRKATMREAIAEYAAKVAGTREDLDEDLEEASLEPWRAKQPPKRPRKGNR